MTQIIKVINIFPKILAFDSTADAMIEYAKKETSNEKVIYDFSGVEEITISFAQEYEYQKKLSKVKISETNIPEEYVNLFMIAGNLFK